MIIFSYKYAVSRSTDSIV